MNNQININNYHNKITEIIENIYKHEKQNLKDAAEIISQSTMDGGLIRVFGVGHSHSIGADVFWRAATLGNVQAILEPSLTGNIEMTKSNKLEKIEGIGKEIFNYHKIKKPDVLVAVSNSGNNAVTIDMAREAKKNNVKVIVITSVAYSNYLQPLHSTGKKLKDFADVVLDNCTPIGDGLLKSDLLKPTVGASSSIASVYIMNAILVEAVSLMLEKGYDPDVYYEGSSSVNKDEVADYNKKIIEKYYYKIRNL